MLGIAAMPSFLHHLHLSENLTDISFFCERRKPVSFLFVVLSKCASTKVKVSESRGQVLLTLSFFRGCRQRIVPFNEGVRFFGGGDRPPPH